MKSNNVKNIFPTTLYPRHIVPFPIGNTFTEYFISYIYILKYVMTDRN